MSALEINRLDKIARRFKRVGGAIADLWGGQYRCFVYYVVVWRKVFLPKKVYPVDYSNMDKHFFLA